MELIGSLEKLTLQVNPSNQNDNFDIAEACKIKLRPIDHALDQLTETGRQADGALEEKIDKILGLGQQIKSIYNEFFCNQPARQHAMADIYRWRQICDDFITLCWTDSAVCELPIISMYNQYYLELMSPLVEIISSWQQNSTNSSQSSISSSDPSFRLNSSQHQSTSAQLESSENMSDDNVPMNEGGEPYELEFDQHKLDSLNWTTNKLYIDG